MNRVVSAEGTTPWWSASKLRGGPILTGPLVRPFKDVRPHRTFGGTRT